VPTVRWTGYRNFVKRRQNEAYLQKMAVWRGEAEPAALDQPRTFLGLWILGATNGAAVIPNAYRLQARNADNTTSFDNYSMFHRASLEPLPRCGNALFG
jgi:hypothetical protein